MANTVPVNTTCYVLRSCTTGDDTVLITSVTVSALSAYVGQHIRISNPLYAGICFSVELLESGCVDCSKAASIIPLTPNPICTCTVVYNYYILTPCDTTLPTFYTAQNLYPYDGTTITFFGQGGVCYTVTGSFNIPQGIASIGVQCPVACQCVIPDCGCPDGYTLNDENLCEGIINVPPIDNSVQYEVDPAIWNDGSFGINAAEFYEDITNKPWPILSTAPGAISIYFDNTLVPLLVTNTLANQIWGGFSSSVNYRMRVAGVWTGLGNLPINEWIGFSYCITLTETKTYYIAYAVDDFARIFIDGTLMLNQDTSGWAFKKLQIFPITLSSGLHIITGEVKNGGGSALFTFEIYDATLAQLLAVALPGDIDPYIVFSSQDQLGLNWQTGENSGYSCPDGYALNTCDGLVCSQIVTVPQLPCFTFKITFCDGVNLDPIITNTDLTQYLGAVYIICYTDGEDEICGCGSVSRADTEVAPDFTGTFSTIFYDCCEKCTQVCYLLEDCQGAVDPIITCTDLSNYVNNIVKLSNCGDICWKVTTSETCTDSILLGEVLENYPATYTTSPICTYAIPDLVKPPISYFININGIPYQFTYTTNSQVIIDLNSLNLGEFSGASNLLVVIGENNYGNLCYRFSLDSQICIPPVCSTYETNCEYINIPQSIGSLIVFITINGTLYTTTLTGFGIGKLLTWLNSLNLGIFTSNCISLICSINVYGNEIYENIVIGTGVESDTYIPSCNNVIDFDAACEECLPPAPEPPPLVLHIRRIKPGYFSTNSCITTEYMERVNCNFAKQVYDAMLIKRYGITVCCDHDVDSWDIKKQGLDFELLGDPNMCKSTICHCLAPCLVDVVLTLLPTCVAPILIEATLDNLCFPPTFTDAIVTLEPEPVPCNCYTLAGSNYTIGWIDCCCEYQSANFLTNATVCAHYLPIILEGSVTITAAEECGSELCVAPPIIVP